MKALIQFIAPTLKAVLSVAAFIVGLGWGAYAAVSAIAKAEAESVRDQIKEIRSNDMEHLNRRFDTIEILMVGKVITKPEVKND